MANRTQKAAAQIIPAGYEILPGKPNPSGACKMYVVTTAVINVAGVVAIQ
ncbi:hypothetical protein [Methanosarcina sp. 2.H.T.1A.15]|nr:hypothetical protein [Methanosarcina sp. 2.H.T.1A.15]